MAIRAPNFKAKILLHSMTSHTNISLSFLKEYRFIMLMCKVLLAQASLIPYLSSKQ